MNHAIVVANLMTMGLNLAYAIVAMIIGIITIKAIDRFMFPQIDFVEEIKKGNMAVALFVSVGILFFAIVLSNVSR
jgi:hypothetical protein